MCSIPTSGVSVVSALKVSKKEGLSWNARPIADQALLADATQLQRAMRMAATSAVPASTKALFYNEGYQSVDESQVIKIDTPVYFRHLMDLILNHGGSIEFGVHLSAADIVALRKTNNVICCLGNEAKTAGGAGGQYYSNPGECALIKLVETKTK